jgi:hypothetical protein
VRLKRRGKRQTKGEKKQGKDERQAQHHTKLNFVCALVGLRLWRSTATYSITQDMAALLMQGVGRERVKLYYEKKRDKKDESLERGIRWKEREEQRKRKAVRVLLSRIKRGDKGELKAPRPSARRQWRRDGTHTEGR